ncbi:MAG: hypothetical protein IPP17_01860 [Bacteroidetes bacterium]|nr:hypothetical protein [Bacteroidota bacterium]
MGLETGVEALVGLGWKMTRIAGRLWAGKIHSPFLGFGADTGLLLSAGFGVETGFDSFGVDAGRD